MWWEKQTAHEERKRRAFDFVLCEARRRRAERETWKRAEKLLDPLDFSLFRVLLMWRISGAGEPVLPNGQPGVGGSRHTFLFPYLFQRKMGKPVRQSIMKLNET